MKIFGRKKGRDVVKEPPPAVGEEVGQVVEPKGELPKGQDAGAYRAVLRPHLTEKATTLGGLNKYVFRVARTANKVEVKRAIEKLYQVKVARVAVLSMPAKYRRVGRHEGYKSGFKKAIVTLAEGEKIDVVA